MVRNIENLIKGNKLIVLDPVIHLDHLLGKKAMQVWEEKISKELPEEKVQYIKKYVPKTKVCGRLFIRSL